MFEDPATLLVFKFFPLNAQLVWYIEGVLHLHKNGIAHRDLKPSNIMYTNKSEDSPIKIIDFDLAKENYARTWYGGTPVGTTDFMAPEIIQKQRYKAHRAVFIPD